MPVPAQEDYELSVDALRWCCDADWLSFESTAEVEPIPAVVGQDDALEALRFGLEFSAPGHNVYVRGLAGTGRSTLVRQVLEDIEPPCPPASDRCYVHSFNQPDRPRLINLPRGKGRLFRTQVDDLVEFIKEQLRPALASDAVRSRRAALDSRVQNEIRELGKPFEEELRENGLALIPVQVGQTVQPAILPIIDGQPVQIDRLRELQASGALEEADIERIHNKIAGFARRFEDVSQKIGEVQARYNSAVQALYKQEATSLLSARIAAIQTQFPDGKVRHFLAEVLSDLVDHRLGTLQRETDFTRLYRVNVVIDHQMDAPCPIVVENSPTLPNLLGNIEREFVHGGGFRSDHLMIQAGSLLRADGGYLVLEARDLLSEPGAWKILLRTLRTGKLEIVPYEFSTYWSGPLLKPEPIELTVKVVLIGDEGLFQILASYDPDFAQLFKVLADFKTTIPRDQIGVRYYAGVLARIAKEEGLRPFDRHAVIALTEHGARIAGRRDWLTARFGRLADIAREAAYLAGKNGNSSVTEVDVRDAILRGRRRADLPARNFRKMIAEGRIRIQTQGAEVGQINGLAVLHEGPLTYGFPTRITATIGPGTAGTVNIEREAELSGAIHTKGFYILGGLLRHLLKTDHPLAFSASVAFEQSYGGIDGDSASGAEMCCLLSALTGVPLRQDLAMTGAIDQLGHIQPIGAVTEKAEGFFAVCQDIGLTGTQGVIIPRANAGDLMLHPEVLRACEEKAFHLYAVDTIHEALEVLTGWKAGKPDEGGNYPEKTLLHLAEQRAREFWRMASQPEA